jgi:hypothetical protein
MILSNNNGRKEFIIVIGVGLGCFAGAVAYYIVCKRIAANTNILQCLRYDGWVMQSFVINPSRFCSNDVSSLTTEIMQLRREVVSAVGPRSSAAIGRPTLASNGMYQFV